jgi:hypothetical protein
MAEGSGRSGLIRVMTPDEVTDSLVPDTTMLQLESDEPLTSQLANYIRQMFEHARNHRDSEQIEDRLLQDLRTYRGQYDSGKLAEIASFSGSKVYSRMTAVKCRGASAILRDIYLSSDRPWSLEPTPDPDLPDEIQSSMEGLVQSEVQHLELAGQTVDQQTIDDRMQGLQEAANKAEKKKAKQEADVASDLLNDILVEGEFYKALNELLLDIPIFLYGCIKGPVVRMTQETSWNADGTRTVEEEPKMFWERVSPFDLYFSPGASRVENATIFERVRLSRDELYDLIGTPGYNEDAIRSILNQMNTGASGMAEWLHYFELERADLENREDPNADYESRFIDVLEYHGYVRGQYLLDWGMPENEIDDPDREYFITCWLIHNEIIKAQLNPNPRNRPNYYVTSFEKVPGSIYGNGLPEILSDIQDVANATLRALVNNLAIASGPQVIVDDERIAPNADSDTLFPWKRWHVVSDPLSGNTPPVSFFQPQSNSAELLGVYKEFTNMADEISAIPRYLTGSQRTGGAAATASGLAMLMNNASKVMQGVAANIDEDIITPILENLYDMVMLTKPGLLRGDENVVVKGVANAIQKEQDRVRQLEFLNLTANPIDMQLIGPKGRAGVLRAVAENLGLDYEDIVADDEQVQQMLQQANLQGPAQGGGLGSNPNEAKSAGAGPRTDRVSNVSTI